MIPHLPRSRKSLLFFAILLFALLENGVAFGQILIAGDSRPAFEVATIKPSKTDAVGIKTSTYQGSFTAEHANFKNLLKFAYRVKSDDEIVGMPKWSETDYFDVNAKVDDQTAQAIAKLPVSEMMGQTRLRVQSLLADRFHLSVATRDESRKVYCLVVSKDGSKLKEVESAATVAVSAPANHETPPPPPPGPGKPGTANNPLDSSQSDRLVGRGASMEMLAQWLSRRPEVGDRTVLNQTGLGGRYDFALVGISPILMDGVSPSGDAQASVFTLIHEQLGLQLQIRSAPIKVLVIETIARPSAN